MAHSDTAFVRSGHEVGLALTDPGSLLLILVAWQYPKTVTGLARIRGLPLSRVSPVLLAAVFVVLLGCSVSVILLASGD
jgi:hypothetical protein